VRLTPHFFLARRLQGPGVNAHPVRDGLRAIISRFAPADPLGRHAGDEPPLRSELFNADQM